jgi:hypothetical protein
MDNTFLYIPLLISQREIDPAKQDKAIINTIKQYKLLSRGAGSTPLGEYESIEIIYYLNWGDSNFHNLNSNLSDLPISLQFILSIPHCKIHLAM